MDQSSSQRPRANSRAFSHRSDKSSGSKQPKEHLTDNPAEKKRRDSFWKGASKANPNAAMNEVQPGDAAVLEKPTIETLRGHQHKDSEGNLITEPDLSNPTRPRWERPLDTIRSFERAIDGGYKRRSISRSESYDIRDQYASRRSSAYGAAAFDNGRSETGPSPSRFSNHNGGYYGSRRPDSYYDDGTSPMAPPSRNRFGQRVISNPNSIGNRSNGAHGMHPQHNYNDAYDSGVTGSDGTGPWANSTDPSSENSSIDKAHAAGKHPHAPQGMDNYAYEGHNGGRIMEENASDSDGAYGPAVPRAFRNGRNGQGFAAPPVPGHSSQAPPVRAPIKLGDGPSALASQGGSLPSTARVAAPKEEKKKGFFKKRFGKD